MKLSARNLRTALAFAVIALTAGLTARRANADQWNKRTVLTVNETIQVRDTVLEPGQYVFRLLNSDSDRHIVQIFNGDQSRLIDTVFAVAKERAHLTGDSQFTFWETPPGTAKALRAWFYPGDAIGQEFPYPKRPHLIAMVASPEPAPAPSAAMTEPAPESSAAPQPAVEEPAPAMPSPAAPVAEARAPSSVSGTEETANAPAQAESQPEPAQPEELPKTGSSRPLFGITGVALLALAGFLRLWRPASR
jgi:LPXTG-motif cell wall-anchored protein